tara:strand:+ start:8944 stop:10377 length:1434 start_codon:yes stop_codon:yes gene_type:complete
MTVVFRTANTGIFTRLGKLFGILERMEAFQSDVLTASGTSIQEAVNEYITSAGSTANRDLSYINAFLSDTDQIANEIGAPILRRVKEAATKTLIEMMQDELESRDPVSGLPSKTVEAALFELRAQMIAESTTETLNGPAVSVDNTVAAATGTGTVLVSVEPNNQHHSTLATSPVCREETLRFRCVADKRDGNHVPGGERFEVRGGQSYSATDYRWPGGSGFVGSFNACSPELSEGRKPGRNILRNSSFESFVSGGDTPTNWEIVVGAASSSVFKDESIFARGTRALKQTCNGSTLIKIRQKLGDGNVGSAVSVRPDGLYALAFEVRYSGTNPSAGALKVGLANSSGTYAAGTFATVSHDLTTSFVRYSVTFRAPLDLADPIYLQIEQSTAFTDGTILHVDGMLLAEMVSTAKGGASFLIVPGSTDFVVGDEVTVDVNNDYSGQFYRYFDRFFDLRGSGILLPGNVEGGETVSDSLIA